MLKEEVVLINDCGCEIARELIESNKSYENIVSGWVLHPGDKIIIRNVWCEEI